MSRTKGGIIAKLASLATVLVFSAFLVIGCGGENPSGPNGGGGNGLTFSDGLPTDFISTGNFVIQILPNNTDIEDIGEVPHISFGGSSGVSGNKVLLFTSNKPWNGSGTYMVVVIAQETTKLGNEMVWKYIKDVTFSGGNATIKKSDMIVLVDEVF
jgi:hypothetical protein